MNKLFFLFVVITLISCSNEQINDTLNLGKQSQTIDASIDDQMEAEPTRTAEPTMSSPCELDMGSKIIKNGTLGFEVSDLNIGKRLVDSLLVNRNAYYENEQYDAHYNRLSYTLLIRIPNIHLDSLLIELEGGIGKLTDKNISVKDVTEEYVDLNIRLENNLAYLRQYQEILKKAKRIKEILEAQGEIRRIEEEIEGKKGRINYLDSKVKFSTLRLTITELINTSTTNKTMFGRRISNAFSTGVEGFLSFLIIVVSLWPFLIFALVLFLFKKKLKNRLWGR